MLRETPSRYGADWTVPAWKHKPRRDGLPKFALNVQFWVQPTYGIIDPSFGPWSARCREMYIQVGPLLHQ